jgi:hypothetical protein
MQPKKEANCIPKANGFSTRRQGASRRSVYQIHEDGERHRQQSRKFIREGYNVICCQGSAYTRHEKGTFKKKCQLTSLSKPSVSVTRCAGPTLISSFYDAIPEGIGRKIFRDGAGLGGSQVDNIDVPKVTKEILETIEQQFKPDKETDIHFLLAGFSRGSITSILAAQAVQVALPKLAEKIAQLKKKTASTILGQLKSSLRFQLILSDPVPGLFKYLDMSARFIPEIADEVTFFISENEGRKTHLAIGLENLMIENPKKTKVRALTLPGNHGSLGTGNCWHPKLSKKVKQICVARKIKKRSKKTTLRTNQIERVENSEAVKLRSTNQGVIARTMLYLAKESGISIDKIQLLFRANPLIADEEEAYDVSAIKEGEELDFIAKARESKAQLRKKVEERGSINPGVRGCNKEFEYLYEHFDLLRELEITVLEKKYPKFFSFLKQVVSQTGEENHSNDGTFQTSSDVISELETMEKDAPDYFDWCIRVGMIKSIGGVTRISYSSKEKRNGIKKNINYELDHKKLYEHFKNSHYFFGEDEYKKAIDLAYNLHQLACPVFVTRLFTRGSFKRRIAEDLIKISKELFDGGITYQEAIGKIKPAFIELLSHESYAPTIDERQTKKAFIKRILLLLLGKNPFLTTKNFTVTINGNKTVSLDEFVDCLRDTRTYEKFFIKKGKKARIAFANELMNSVLKVPNTQAKRIQDLQNFSINLRQYPTKSQKMTFQEKCACFQFFKKQRSAEKWYLCWQQIHRKEVRSCNKPSSSFVTAIN